MKRAKHRQTPNKIQVPSTTISPPQTCTLPRMLPARVGYL